ncbi:lipopolysaccharide biosynthesis protein [Gordonia alkanivorans]|uniref:lipopolysaccharide biosynthesis protein n=1 Tax=Gordonia alkanivorans TaxID=84096 RepID=UPI00244932D7|nr:lipopolysaccharide biosynthesis protein [Gordonia alkanivorans]MDH3009318.1 lipopolysaccharide biosynthesis protein [Gordonia alkanivorans]
MSGHPPLDAQPRAGVGAVALRGGAVTLAAQGLRVLLTLSTLIVLARLLSPADFGLVAMVIAIAGVAELIRDFGLFNAAVQADDLSTEQKDNLFWTNTLLGFVGTALVASVSPLIVLLYDEPRLLAVSLAVSPIFLLNGISTQFRVELNRGYRFGALALGDLIPQLAALIVACTMAICGAGYWALVGQQISTALCGLIVVFVLTKWRPGRPHVHSGRIVEQIRYGANLFGTQLLAYASRNADSVVIGRYVGSAALGIYDRAFQLLMAPINQINAPLTRVALPILSRARFDRELYVRYLLKSQLVAAYVTCTLFFVAAGLSDKIVLALFGSDWTAAADILRILALGGVFRSSMQISYWIFLSSGKTDKQFQLDLVLQPAIVVSLCVGVAFGLEGVAWAHTIAYAVYWAASLWWAGRAAKLPVLPLAKNSIRIMLSVGLPLFAMSALVNESAMAPVLSLGVGVLMVIGWIAVVSTVVPSCVRDRRELVGVLQARRRRSKVTDDAR